MGRGASFATRAGRSRPAKRKGAPEAPPSLGKERLLADGPGGRALYGAPVAPPHQPKPRSGDTSPRLRWSPVFGQTDKLGSPYEEDGPDDGQAEAVFGGVQGEGGT
jgi:hypothetical protein